MDKKFYFKINQVPAEGAVDFVYKVNNKPLSSGEKGIGEFVAIWAKDEIEACYKKENSYGDKAFLSLDDNFYFTITDPIGEYLIYTEISPVSIIMIDMEDGSSEPYYVDQKRNGLVTKATMLLGYKLKELIKNPGCYPCSTTGGTDRFYIGNDEVSGGNKDVKGYRFPTKEEKLEWFEKIKSFKRLMPLQELLVN